MRHLEPNHYIPILKGKMGELEALSKTNEEIRRGFTPFLEIPPIPSRWLDNQEEPVPSKTIEDHIDGCSNAFARHLEGYEHIFVDGAYIQNETPANSAEEPIARFVSRVSECGVGVIPVAGIDRLEEYNQAVAQIAQDHGSGLCIRLTESDLEDIAISSEPMTGLLAFLNATVEETDLLLDFGPRVPSRAAIPFQLRAIPHLTDWRSLTMAATSFPADLGNARKRSITQIEREEWAVWSFLNSRRESIERLPIFSDYAINHPEYPDIDPRIMNPSPNIRYTAPASFVVAKGEGVRRRTGQNIPPSQQLPQLARMIMDHNSWRGENFSWGDQFIFRCARGGNVGNPANWRSVGTSHHIAVVVHQLSNLP